MSDTFQRKGKENDFITFVFLRYNKLYFEIILVYN